MKLLRPAAIALAAFAGLSAVPASASESAPPATPAPSAPTALASSPALTITLAHDSPGERATRDQLLRLLQAHDVSRWTLVHEVRIDEDAVPHSDPVLTLHTRHLLDDDLLLSTYVHEQMHHYLAAHHEEAQAAMDELAKAFPHIPVGYPQGSDSPRANQAHLLVILFERRADQLLMGELRTQAVMTLWQGDHYTWLYRTLADPAHREVVRRIAARHHLDPAGTAPAR